MYAVFGSEVEHKIYISFQSGNSRYIEQCLCLLLMSIQVCMSHLIWRLALLNFLPAQQQAAQKQNIINHNEQGDI